MSSSSDPDDSSAADPWAWLMDMPCGVDFVLGEATVKLRECLDFQPQRIIRLTQPAGSDVEVRVAGVAIATGEVVVSEDTAGLRITRILRPRVVDPR